MSSKDKLISRFLSLPSDFTWDEMNRLLVSLGYSLGNKGKTSGSRVIYKRKERKPVMLHRPHPGNIIKEYALKQILNLLRDSGDL